MFSASEERNDQVARIDRVYLEAYAWLGAGDENIKEVVRLTSNLKNRTFSYNNDFDLWALQRLPY